jgi:hypothetical protein
MQSALRRTSNEPNSCDEAALATTKAVEVWAIPLFLQCMYLNRGRYVREKNKGTGAILRKVPHSSQIPCTVPTMHHVQCTMYNVQQEESVRSSFPINSTAIATYWRALTRAVTTWHYKHNSGVGRFHIFNNLAL